MNINRTPSFLVPAELDSGLKRLAALRAESVDALVGDILREGLRARGGRASPRPSHRPGNRRLVRPDKEFEMNNDIIIALEGAAGILRCGRDMG